MGKYLNDTGLSYFWGKLKAYFVAKEAGKGLSTNDFTDTLKTKLDGIATGANNYSLPTASSSTLGGIKVGAGLTISSGVLSAAAQVVDVTASKTLALTDTETLQDCSSSSAIEVTIPLNSSVAFPIGASIGINRLGSGTVTVKLTSGVTLNGGSSNIAIKTQYKGAVLRKLGTNTWLLQGDV